MIFRILIICLLICCPLFADEQKPGLVISGVDGAAAENIERSINLSRYQCADSDWQLSRLQKSVLKQAETALQAIGYYHSEFTTSLLRNPECWNLKLDVFPGTQVIVKDLSVLIEGDMSTLPASQSYLEDLPLKPGDVLHHGHYEAIKTEIEVIAARYGFFSGEFTTRQLDIDTQNNLADIVLVYASGPRASFNQVQIVDATYENRLLQQYMLIKEGMPYDSQLLIQQQQLLNGSGYFSGVDVVTTASSTDASLIDVSISLEAVKKHAYRIGIGASTDVGPRVSFALNNRRVNRRGHDFSFNSSYSPVQTEIALNYGVPKGNAGADRLDYQVGYLQEDTDSSDLESYKAAILQTHLNRHDWITTTFLEYLYEDFKTADSNRLSKLLMPGFKLQKTVVKNSIFPRKGWRANASLRLAAEDLLSSTSLIHISAGFKFVLPVHRGRLLVRTDLGASEVEDFEKLPASLRFFAGGDASVRGFDYKSLGPTNENDEVIGGQYLLTGSAEYEYPIRKNWGIAAFIDSGNAFNNLNDYELSTGAGLGIRWHSPIGPIRLDVAQDVNGEHSPRLHLSMGLDL